MCEEAFEPYSLHVSLCHLLSIVQGYGHNACLTVLSWSNTVRSWFLTERSQWRLCSAVELDWIVYTLFIHKVVFGPPQQADSKEDRMMNTAAFNLG